MTSRERVIKTFKFEEVDRIPREISTLPGILMYRKDEWKDVTEKFPFDIMHISNCYGKGFRCTGTPAAVGKYTDAWGVVWHVGEPGVAGEVKEFIFSDWSALDSYKLPWELLDGADMSQVNRKCEATDKFTITGTEVRPFERMQFLRGTENIFMDLAYGDIEVYKLRDMLHEFFVRELDMWSKTDIDAIQIQDDWGTQKSLLISPAMWREFFKPLYKEYCDIMHSKGKYVFMHSDGNIEAIFSDLVEIGINAVNSQLFCMDMEKLGELYSNKIVFWGEIDRQYLLPFGKPEEVRQGVRRVADALIRGKKTGVLAQCEWGLKDPKENIEAVFDEWNKV